MVIDIIEIVDNYVDKLLITFDNIEVEHRNVSSVFTLQNSKLDHCKCKAFLLDTIKYTVILYYYNIFSCHAIGGVVYIFRTSVRLSERHIWCFHASTPILSSIPSSTKRPFYAIFATSHHIKNHQKHLQNTSQPL